MKILRIHPGGLTVEQSSAGRCGEGRPHAQSAHCIRPKAGGSCTQLAHKVARPTVELLGSSTIQFTDRANQWQTRIVGFPGEFIARLPP